MKRSAESSAEPKTSQRARLEPEEVNTASDSKSEEELEGQPREGDDEAPTEDKGYAKEPTAQSVQQLKQDALGAHVPSTTEEEEEGTGESKTEVTEEPSASSEKQDNVVSETPTTGEEDDDATQHLVHKVSSVSKHRASDEKQKDEVAPSPQASHSGDNTPKDSGNTSVDQESKEEANDVEVKSKSIHYAKDEVSSTADDEGADAGLDKATSPDATTAAAAVAATAADNPVGFLDGADEKSSYPQPKNFAERMMNALETGLASESMWWVGGGKAVALCPKKLRQSDQLTSFFKAKDYSAFIRNCNRWGFRRVTHYAVKPGIVTYENALFQKDQPHLVKHMRMDSDVQDVFARHQQDGGETNQAEGKLATAKFMQSGRGGGRRYRKRADPKDDKGATSAAVGGGAALPNIPVAPGGDTTMGKELLLRKILQLTEDFVTHPGTLTSSDEAFQTNIQIFRALGQQHQQELINNGHMAKILQLESSLQQDPAVTTTSVPPVFSPPAMAGVAQQASMLFNPGAAHAAAGPFAAAAQGFLGHRGAGASAVARRLDPLQALLLQQNAMLLQQQISERQGVGANMLSQFMSNRMLFGPQGQATGFAASAGGAQPGGYGAALASAVAAGSLGGLQQANDGEDEGTREPGGATEQEERMQQAGEEQKNDDAPTEESPQYTSAQELMMRVMRQRQQHGPGQPGRPG